MIIVLVSPHAHAAACIAGQTVTASTTAATCGSWPAANCKSGELPDKQQRPASSAHTTNLVKRMVRDMP
jgi:hypothetical protein